MSIKNNRLTKEQYETNFADIHPPFESEGAALVEAIVRDEKKLMPCCVSLDGEYGQKDICLGVPVVIGKNGWEKIIDFKLNEEEKAAFRKSADAVRSMNGALEL